MITFFTAFKKKYYQQSKYILKHIKHFNAGKEPDWQDLKKLFLIGLVEYFKSEVCQNSARLYCALIKSLLNDYSEDVEIPCREYESILSLKKGGVMNISLDEGEIKKIIGYIPVNDLEHTVKNQFLISCLTGARHSDALTFGWGNIHVNELTYVAKKTNQVVRTISNRTIERLIRERKTDVYPDDVFNETIRDICRKAGIKKRSKVVKAGKTLTGEKWMFVASHTARRSFATNLYLHTKDILLVSKLMGHSDIKITQGYLCCDYSDNKDVREYFERFAV